MILPFLGTSCNWDHRLFVFYMRLLSFSIMFSRFIHVVAHAEFSSFRSWMISHYMYDPCFVYPFSILWRWIWGLLLVMVKNAAINVNVRVSIDLFFVVSELTFVEWKEVADRWIRISVILTLFDGKSGLPVARESLRPGDCQGGTKVEAPQLVKEGPENLWQPFHLQNSVILRQMECAS